jgi:two-component system chemotaxis response regulator CheY
MNSIMIVDDATTVRLYHRYTLAATGWTVVEAGNGAEALEKVLNQPQDQPFELFVVDVNMPMVDGYRFVRELRRLPLCHQAPVVMVSTEARRHDVEAALAAGANTYLVKPVAPADLQLTVALMLGDATRARAAAARALGEPA